ncbi:hypothetical protein LCGC14_1383060 [marine sediment metagenome]|uniref:Uncharacterized protein n=1 Tax=marine sediment metagenome TaxID=412755 RepID=A0A0F9N3S4_9ZZZZ
MTYMEDLGPYSVPIVTLSSKWKCNRNTIKADIKFLIKSVDFKAIDEEGKKLLLSIRKNIQLSEQLRSRGKDKDRLKAIEVMNKSAETLHKMLVQFGYKEEKAQKLEISGIERPDIKEIVRLSHGRQK